MGLTRLKPAAPGVELSTVWPDTVKRGPMVREVRGLGTLVPEDTMLITAVTDGRVERILIRPGTPVKADSVVMIMTSPELETALLDAEYALKAAEADYANLKVTLQKALLDMQSTAAQVGADYNTARLQADRDAALAKEALLAEPGRQDLRGEGPATRASGTRSSRSGCRSTPQAEQAQLDSQRVKVEQLRGAVRAEEEPGGPVEGAGRVRRHACRRCRRRWRRWRKARRCWPARRSARWRSRPT